MSYLFSLFFTLFSLGGVFYFYKLIIEDLPDPRQLPVKKTVVSTKIYDREKKLLYKIYRSQNRTIVPLEKIPIQLVNATIAIEDKDFWKHKGFSLRGIIRAIRKNLFNQKLEGGSTITQQLIKNTLLNDEKTLKRKIRELVLSIQTEALFSKKQILEMYFNQVPYGGAAWGAEEAAQLYFGKSASELSLAQSALLAGLPAAPTKYSPFGADPKLALNRQRQVLQRMHEENYITESEKLKAESEKLSFVPQKTDIKAPHFVMYVKDLLVERYGQRLVEEGGLEVITSLDLDLQNFVQEEVKKEIGKLASLRVSNGAALITKPTTGEVLAIVGSKDYWDTSIDGNVNITTSLQQPGSAIKVVNYAVALQSGLTPASIIADTPVAYRILGSLPYIPVNYDNRFHGNVTLRTALASSYNVPAVKVLNSYGVNKMITMGKIMGITTWDRSGLGLSLTLGGAEVKMVDLAVVYGTLANMGKRVDLNPILKVTDYRGKVLEETLQESHFLVAEAAEIDDEQVVPPTIAFQLTDILSDNQARTPAFGPNSLLKIPGHQVAVKTGTSNDKRDNWTIGYTKDYLVTTWVGNNDNSPMSGVASGITGATPIWNHIMTYLLKEKSTHYFEKPNGLLTVKICRINGLLSCDGCPTTDEYFLPGTEPKIHCSFEKMKKEEEEKKTLQAATIH